jgi:Zn-finger nucleic acid-binding protein
MSEERRKFATIDGCPQCKGVFLDPGEAVTALGQREDVTALVASGAARSMGTGALACPNGHGRMTIFRFGPEEGPVEIDVCTTCQGAFFDAGETEILEEITRRAGEPTVTTAGGARFSAPPTSTTARASHESVVDQFREERGGNAFATFFSDLARASTTVVAAGTHRHHHRGFRWRW